MAILKRQPLFPHVIELNHQARRRISCSVYLIYDDDNNWALIDIGYEDAVDDCLEIIRQLDFPFSKCVTLIASHADVDHIQGFAKAKQILKTTVTCHPLAAKPLETGDKLMTYAEIAAQNIHLEMPPVKVENAGRRRRPDPRRQPGARSLAHAGPHRRPAFVPARQAAVLGRQPVPRRLRRRDRRPSWQQHPGLHQVAAADPCQRRRMAAAQPRPGVPQGRPAHRPHDRPAGNLSPHGRLRHLCDRLAADGPVGTRAGRRQDAGVDVAGDASAGRAGMRIDGIQRSALPHSGTRPVVPYYLA